jgi:thioredoxin-dependent peroxiredoxin
MCDPFRVLTFLFQGQVMSLSIRRFGVVAMVSAFLTVAVAVADDPPQQKAIELKVGDPAPDFALRDDRDRLWRSSDHVGKKWIVVYFYPGDFTPGCTAQAKAFKDAMTKLKEQGVEVVGISGDMANIHAKFKKAEQLNFTLLSDGHGTVSRKFGVPFGKGATVKVRATPPFEAFEFERPGTAARWTFIIDPEGKVAYKNIKVIPGLDAKAISEFIANEEKK